MSRKKEVADSERFRFTVPGKDVETLAWINEQSNLSYSLRSLIRQSVARDGIVDITCKPITPGVSPGRPRSQPKSAVQDEVPHTQVATNPVLSQSPQQPQAASKPQVQADDDGFVDPAAFF